MLLSDWMGRTPEEQDTFQTNLAFEIRRQGVKTTAVVATSKLKRRVAASPNIKFPGWKTLMELL